MVYSPFWRGGGFAGDGFGGSDIGGLWVLVCVLAVLAVLVL